jgi:hypothetical protein
MAREIGHIWFGVKSSHFVAVFSSLLLAALFNTLILILVGIYPPEAAGALAPAYAAALLAAFTVALSRVFKFSRDDAIGLGIANAAVLLAMAVAWKFVAENLEYPLGPQLSSGLIFALASALLYVAILYLALPKEKSR